MFGLSKGEYRVYQFTELTRSKPIRVTIWRYLTLNTAESTSGLQSFTRFLSSQLQMGGVYKVDLEAIIGCVSPDSLVRPPLPLIKVDSAFAHSSHLVRSD